MPPRLQTIESRERMIWGEPDDRNSVPSTARHLNGPKQIDDDIDGDSDIQEISPPPGYRRQSYPARVVAGAKRVSLSSQNSLGSPQSQISTPRRRPRGPDVGKSIHKAAEASPISPPSVSQLRARRRSVGSTKRIIPALLPSDAINHSLPKDFARTYARKTAGSPEPHSQKRKAKSLFGPDAKSISSSAALAIPPRSQFSSPRSKGDTSYSSLGATAGIPRAPSPLSITSSPIKPRQVARKGVSSKKPRKQLATKAARKTSLQYYYSSEEESDSSSDGWTSLGSSLLHSDDFLGSDVKTAKAVREGSSSDGKKTGSEDTSSESSESEHDTQHNAKKLNDSGGDVRTGSASLQLPSTEFSSRTHSRSLAIPAALSPSHSLHIGISVLPSGAGALKTNTARSSLVDSDRETPPPPLIAAFESLSAYTLHMHRTNSLPFLLRNVRTSFRSWCQKLHIPTDADAKDYSHPLSLVPLRYEYIAGSGELYVFDTVLRDWECPVCSIFGVFPSWPALRKHVRWDHREIELEAELDQTVRGRVLSVTVRMQDPRLIKSLPHTSPVRKSDETPTSEPAEDVALSGYPLDEARVGAHHDVLARKSAQRPWSKKTKRYWKSPPPPPPQRQGVRIQHDEVAEDRDQGENQQVPQDPELSFRVTAPRSRSSASSTSRVLTTSNDAFDSHQTTASELDAGGPVHTPPGSQSPPAQRIPSLRPVMAPKSPGTRSLNPAPLPAPHEPTYMVAGPNDTLHVQPTTYRPTGPHAYDHLSSLPLDKFGHRSWFVLDKEEEIFELTDVLDEDKVICALWGRWILLNRSFFIRNYLTGVEAFVDEYWLMIHRAAGWGALRAWLMMLASRRFLKNNEMVQVLRRYNGLVGKAK